MARLEVVPWENVALTLQLANTDLVINATPLGLKRSDPPPLPASLLMPHLMVYDTTYGSRSPFLSAAREAGARTADGMSMLLHQGALAFERWFDRAAPVDEMRRALKAAAG
jgi:shikimate dehydrogenase